jgi:N-acetylneuraminic acid mutarotase
MSYKTTKICALFVISALALPFLNSCQTPSSDLIGNWAHLSDFDGLPRNDAVGFSIGSKGYLGTGYDGNERLNDFWQYDPSKDSWTQMDSLPGVPRNGAVGFGTDTKGYIGTGYDGTNKLKDFYEYDPAANKWTRKTDFGGTARYAALGMAINNKGYVGTGYDGYTLKDFWQYDPGTDSWTQKTSLGGTKRRNATCFVIAGKGYVVTGTDNGTSPTDFWQYDPDNDSWTKEKAIANLSTESYDNAYSTYIEGAYKVGFAINGKGYVATGGSTGKYVWEYDPTTDLWVERTSFEGSGRNYAVGFAIGNFGYVATGLYGSNTYLDDLWSFDPEAIVNLNDN